MINKFLLLKFIIYIISDLCYKFGVDICITARYKQRAESAPPQVLSASKNPGQIGLNKLTILDIRFLENIEILEWGNGLYYTGFYFFEYEVYVHESWLISWWSLK